MTKRRIAVIGVGKIAQDQHIPVITASSDFELAAVVSTRGVGHGNAPVFRTPAELYRKMPDIGIVSVCTPPGVRHSIVREALDAGKDVLMEKPPTTTISEFDDLVLHAHRTDRVLFQTWHSRYNAAVERTKSILEREGVASLRIDWRESVRKWHPGQEWVWEPGGFGVFDPGINALSIFTEIVPFPVFVHSARLIFPSNRLSPVEAELTFKSGDYAGRAMSAHFDWLEESGEIWTISVKTGAGRDLKLEKGGTLLKVGGGVEIDEPAQEYERIYEKFADLLEKRRSETDGSPLRLAADAFLLGARENAAPFAW